MRISTSKSKTMVLGQKRSACLFWVGGEVLPQVERLKYLRVLFTSEGRMECGNGGQMGAALGYWTIVVKKELSRKAKLAIYQPLCVPTLTCGHEFCLATQKTRSQIQSAQNGFPLQGGWVLPYRYVG